MQSHVHVPQPSSASTVVVAPELPDDCNWIIDLRDRDQDALIAGVPEVMSHDYRQNAEAWVTEAQMQSLRLSPELHREFWQFRRYSNRRAALLIRGLPIGVVPDTPALADNSIAPTLTATATSSMLCALFGEQFSFKPELGGQLFQSVLPQRGLERTQRSVGSDIYLEDHGEMVFTEHRAHYVVLTCVRADHEGIAGTALASIDDILLKLKLKPETVETLRQPVFKTTVDESFVDGWGLEGDYIVEPIPVLEGCTDSLTLRVDFAETSAINDTAQDALKELKAVVQDVRRAVRLRAGEMLIVDNARAMHGRTPFVPRYDGKDRWLLRTFITRDLHASRAVRPNDGRVVDPDYKAWAKK